MIATICSADRATLLLDNLIVPTSNISQIMAAVYEKKSIKKMHLLDTLKKRSSLKGVVGSELCIVLISDFVQTRFNQERINNRVKADFAEFNDHSTSPSRTTKNSSKNKGNKGLLQHNSGKNSSQSEGGKGNFIERWHNRNNEGLKTKNSLLVVTKKPSSKKVNQR